jgi:hypothetical protein
VFVKNKTPLKLQKMKSPRPRRGAEAMNNEKKITINPLPYSPFGGRGLLKK